VKNYNKDRDLIILKVKPAGKVLEPVALGDSSKIQSGETVYAIGNPLDLANSMSEGIISSVNRIIDNQGYIQITTPLSAGSSGGALVNTRSELIGITTATIKGGQNLNLAVPVNDLKALNSTGSETELIPFLKIWSVAKPVPGVNNTAETNTTIPDVGESIKKESEPNHTIEEANILPNGTTVYASLYDYYDMDVYQISPTKNSKIEIYLAPEDSYFTRAFCIVLEDRDGNIIAYNLNEANESGKVMVLTYTCPSTDTYYVRIMQNFFNSYMPEEEYVLYVRWE